jgi:S1-C subfamily serine protease
MKKILIPIVTSALLTSCASIFLPKKHRIEMRTTNPESVVYLNNEEIGKGPLVKTKIKKNGLSQQIVVQTPGYKDNHIALVQNKRPAAYWPLYMLNFLNFYGLFVDHMGPKGVNYQREIELKPSKKLVYKTTNDKYIDISDIQIDFKNKYTDIEDIEVPYATDEKELEKRIQTRDSRKESNDKKNEIERSKSKAKKLVEKDKKELFLEDTKFTNAIYKTLKQTGFVDTVNTFFSDYNNTLVIEGKISKVYYYKVDAIMNSYHKCKIYITWLIKNNFNEILDSIVTKEYSGEFSNFYSNNPYLNATRIRSSEDAVKSAVEMLGDAVDNSYLGLYENPIFLKYTKTETDFKNHDPLLKINPSKEIEKISDKSDAGKACVIIKTKDGHGSGFAISSDGYILTNYHNVCSKINNKLNSFKVITFDGKEIEGKVVRFNKFRDLALIKVDNSFEKVFQLENIKSFKNLQEVLTIGAPKSVELGQSVSMGMISNERKINNNNLLQLNMSVNFGNSGGPIFESSGKLHGVVVSKLVGKNTEGISFAIPAYLISEYLNISCN